MNRNIALRCFLHNHGNIATEGSSKTGLCPTLISMTSRVLYSAQYHRQHCTPHAFEQFVALYMHIHDDKYPRRPGLEPGTLRLQAPVDTNEPSGPALVCQCECCVTYCSNNYLCYLVTRNPWTFDTRPRIYGNASSPLALILLKC